MKTSLTIFCIVAVAAACFASPVRTKVIPATAAPLVLKVDAQKQIQILNFVHDGSAAGTIDLLKNGTTTKIMTSVVSTGPETRKAFYVSGPATVTIHPAPGSTLTISYRRNPNSAD